MDDALFDRLIALNPAPAEAVATLDLGGAEREFALEVAGVTGRSHWRLPRLPRLALAGAAFALVAAVALVIGLGGGSDQHSAYAAEAVKVAEANPRFLVTAPGWSVKSADDFSEGFGTMVFARGDEELELNWNPAAEYQDVLDDRRADQLDSFELAIAGRQSFTHSYPPRDGLTELESVIPPVPGEGVFVYVRGSFPTRADYEAVVTSMTSTDIDTWLAAMPPSVVDPSEQRDTAEQMLTGIPLPPGFDLDHVLAGVTVASRYQLAARVTGFITCGWLDSWTAAQRDGDQAAAQRAVDAMATAKDWPILNEIDSQGGWPEAVREYARKLADGDVKRSHYDQEMNCIDWR